MAWLASAVSYDLIIVSDFQLSWFRFHRRQLEFVDVYHRI